MNPALRFVLVGTQGGETRIRVLGALDDRSQNTAHLAETLDVSQATLDHHLGILVENGLIERHGADPEAPYQITRRTRADWGDVEDLLDRADEPAAPLLGIFVI